MKSATQPQLICVNVAGNKKMNVTKPGYLKIEKGFQEYLFHIHRLHLFSKGDNTKLQTESTDFNSCFTGNGKVF